MRKFYRHSLAVVTFLIAAFSGRAQQNAVAIGTSTADQTAVLLLVGNDKQGLIIPTTSNISTTGSSFGKAGMIVYNLSDNKVYYFDGGANAWKTVGATGSSTAAYTISFNATTFQIELTDGTTVQKIDVAMSGDVSGTKLNATSVTGLRGKPIAAAASSPNDAQLLIYNNTSGAWTPVALSGDATSTNAGVVTTKGLLGKTLPSLPSSLQFLVYDGTTNAWKFQTISGGGDMLKATYDPQNKNGDAFDLTKHTGILALANGGTGLSTTTPANGQLLIGNGAGYTLATLTGGTGISVTNGAGTSTIATTGSFGTQNLTTTGTLSSGAATHTSLAVTGTTAFNGKTYTWPSSISAGVLTTDASGNLTWAPAGSSLPTLTANQFLGNNGASSLGVSAAGDVSLAIAGTTGTFTIANSAITDAKVSATAAIAGSKIAPAFGAQNISTTGTLSSGAATLSSITVPGTTTLNGKVYTWPATSISGALTNDGLGNLTWAAVAGLGTVTNVTGTAPITVVNNTTTPAISISQANTTTNGYLSSTDWNTFNKVATVMTAAGDIIYGGASGTPTRLATGTGFLRGGATPSYSAVNIASTDVTGVLPIANGGTGANSAAGGLANLGAMSSTLASGKIFVGSAGNVATAQSVSGDGTLSNTGVLTLSNLASTRTNLGLGSLATLSSIADANVSAGAAIAGSKITPAFVAQNISTTGTLSAGASTLSSLIVSGTTKFSSNTYTWPGSALTAGTFLQTDASGNLTWSAPPSQFNINNFVPKGNGTGMVASLIEDNGTGVGINGVPDAAHSLLAYDLSTNAALGIDNLGVKIGDVLGGSSGNYFYTDFESTPGKFVFSGANIGINNNAPNFPIDLTAANYGFSQSDGTGIMSTFLGSGAGLYGGSIGTQTDHPFFIYVGSNGPKFVVSNSTNNYNVGIGTTTPASPLEVNGNIVNSAPSFGSLGLTGDLPGYSTNTYPTLKTTNNYMYFSASGNYSAYLGGTSDGVFGLNNAAAVANVYLNSNGTSYLNGGNVGIGTTAPAGKFHVAGAEWNLSPAVLSSTTGTSAGATLRFSNVASGNHTYDIIGSTGSGAAIGIGAFGIWDNTSGSYRLTISPTGAVSIPGTLSKGSGTFKIDHPADPENKFLYHSFVESPDMMNVYNGNITTGANGEAIVDLPEYFESLNKDFRYQLTVIGEFAQAIVYKKIDKNKFVIKTDKPNIEVSWQVTGIRKDPFAEKNRVVPEVMKSLDEKGKYLHPEAYGLPPEKGILNKEHP